MESFLAGVGLVFILWEQLVVPRTTSPSLVVLLHFSLLASPTHSYAQTLLLGCYSGGQALGRKAEHHVVSRNYWTGRVVRSLWIWGREKETNPQC